MLGFQSLINLISLFLIFLYRKTLIGKKLPAEEIFEEFIFVIQDFKISEICGI